MGELSHVTRDQVYAWNPDIIVTNNPEFWKARNGLDWATLPAVAQGRVYLAPALPLAGLTSRPRSIGCSGLYGGACALSGGLPGGSAGRSPGFLRRFYRIELDDEQFEGLSQ
jgi:iron complex transport system substrate-binding protein